MLSALFRALWSYRGFILGSVRREFQSKYRNSLLGAAWTILNPLAMILVYTLIFSQVMRTRLPNIDSSFGYSIYLCSGVLTWGLFAEIVGRGQNVFLEQANLLKKLNFPRLCLPVTAVISAFLNFSIIFGLFTLFLLVSGNFPGWVFLGLLPVLLIMTAFATGLGMVLGVLNVFFRDVGQFFGVVMQFWFWLTPIVYPATVLPAWAHDLLLLNPMAGLMEACQAILTHGAWPDWGRLWPATVLSVLLCGWGLQLFRRHAGEMVDEL